VKSGGKAVSVYWYRRLAKEGWSSFSAVADLTRGVAFSKGKGKKGRGGGGDRGGSPT